MKTTIEQIIDRVIDVEKGYVNDPDDPGGETKYGITAAVARQNGYTGAMPDLPLSLARSIYINRYVIEPQFDRIVAVEAQIGAELVDTGVNMGPHRAAEFLQRWLNGFNDTGSRYQNVFVDGRIGNITIGALHAYLKWRGAEGAAILLRALNCIQGARYLAITEANQHQRKHLYGWMRQRVTL